MADLRLQPRRGRARLLQAPGAAVGVPADAASERSSERVRLQALQPLLLRAGSLGLRALGSWFHRVEAPDAHLLREGPAPG